MTAQQKTIAKPAAKTAAKPRADKGVPRPSHTKAARAVDSAIRAKQAAGTDMATMLASAKPTKTEPAAKPAAGPVYFIRDSFRPAAGASLFAYTAAWLQSTGLIDGGSIPRADAVKLAGQTAIAYHTGRTGRMIEKAGAISLAPGGANFFMDRGHDAKTREAYAAMLASGQPDGTLIKSAAAFGAIKPAK